MPDKDALLDWFAIEPQMRAWDIIVALGRDDLNRLIEQAFLERFNVTSFGKPFTARLKKQPTERYLQDFILGPPRLSFDDTGMNDSKANLSMAVVGGSDVVLQHGVQWEVSRLEWIQPMQGPVLRMVLDLEDTPGSIEADGSLNLDLKNTRDFILDFQGDANIERLGGDAFKELFEEIPAADKVFNLGKFLTCDAYFPKLHLFWLRTQANKDPGREGEGAVLAFISKDKNFQGTPPGDNGFHFLIPTDLPACSATVLFRPDYVVFPQFLQSVLSLLDSYDSPILNGLTYEIPNACMSIDMDSTEMTGLMNNDQVRAWGERLYAKGDVLEAIKVGEITSKGNGLTLEYLLGGAEMEMVWEGNLEIPQSFQPKEGFVLKNRYHLFSTGTSFEFELIGSDLQFSANTAGWFEDLFAAIVMLFARMAAAAVLDGMSQYISDSLKKVVQEGGGEVLRKLVQLRFGDAFIAGEGHSRHEIITFNALGKIDGIPDVQPRWPNVPVGGEVQFEVANASGPITWKVEALDDSQEKVGHIDPATGRYTVPADARLSGFVRERICAIQGEESGYSMVTIAHDTLSIAPLVQVLSSRGSMLLDAGSSDASPTFQWKVDGKPAAGNPTGAQILFTAGAPQNYPTFTRVQVSVGAVAREACVITLAKTQANTLKVRIVEMDSDKGEVMLHMQIPVQPGKQLAWSVAFGGGAVNAHADDQAKALFSVKRAATERVAVVKVSVATPGSDPTGVGFIVLPLPLFEYPTIYSKLMLLDSEEVTP